MINEKSTNKKQELEVIPVILSGGSGTRLWPLSCSEYPKQYLNIKGSDSTFEQTVKRISKLSEIEDKISKTIVVGSEKNRYIIENQLKNIDKIELTVILEPSQKNTSAAFTLAAIQSLETKGDKILVMLPADHIINDEKVLFKTIKQAIKIASDGSIVILGVKPNKPETGYGYIEVEKKTTEVSEVSEVKKFIEKPDVIKANEYIKKGNYYWNAGIMIVKASQWINAITEFRKDIIDSTRKTWRTKNIDGRFISLEQKLYDEVPSESVDYAVLEPASIRKFDLKMLSLDTEWSDVGSWDAVWEINQKNESGNVITGNAVELNSNNCLIKSTSRLVTLVEVDNLIVVETGEAVLVTKRNQSQQVKKAVEIINNNRLLEKEIHKKIHRPWGWYESIDEGERFKVKRIHVNSGASLSLQLHHHRAEHWTVVKGTAEIIVGKKKFIMFENQSTYIPVGEKHRLSNPGKMPLELIEIQTGSYLNENDIVRLEDKYDRK